MVCQNRVFSRNRVFESTAGMFSNYYKFLFATKNPLLAASVKVTREERTVPLSDPMAQLHDPHMYVWDHYFSCGWGR